ncbi:MAG: ATP-dependent Clp protease adaptor ClpS [Bacteroidota bacterium]
MVKEKVKPVEHQDNQIQHSNQLILFNDNVNSFDFVIETLVDVCLHDPMQAEQCAWTAHYKGKCAVKEGIFPELKPMHDEMSHRGLTVSIEK